jgi:hypothetical protein
LEQQSYKSMENYTFKMTRVYETLIVVDAENESEAFKKLNELGDMIYTIELEQCCVTEEKIELESVNFIIW